MTKDEAIEKFPVGAVVYLASNKERLMTVSRHITADHDETIWVEFMWFDDQHHLHTGKAFPDALKVRTAAPAD